MTTWRATAGSLTAEQIEQFAAYEAGLPSPEIEAMVAAWRLLPGGDATPEGELLYELAREYTTANIVALVYADEIAAEVAAYRAENEPRRRSTRKEPPHDRRR